MDLRAILEGFAAAGSISPLERVVAIKPENGPATTPAPGSYEL